MKKRVSSKDVAREAGVSRATVSYVLNNVEDVKIKAETRERVVKAARKLGYHPHSIARALKTDKSMSVGVVSRRNIAEDRFSRVLRGIKDALKKHKYSITLCSDQIEDNGNPEYLNYYLSKRIDGIILLSAEEVLDDKSVQKLISLKIPAVMVDYHIKNNNINCVDIDYFHGGYITTSYIIGQGYNRMIYFAPAIDIPQEKERLRGVRTAIKENDNRSLQYREVITGETGLDYGNQVKPLLENNIQIGETGQTALVVSWVNVAYKVLSEAARLRMKVPEDLAVISLAGSLYARLSYPRLSTSDLPLYELGYRSGKILIESINEKKEPISESIPCKLNIREST